MKKKGKFIVFEGIDGSGKSTQMKLLAGRLKGAGFKVETIDFPQYHTKSGGLVEEYLSGKYGSASEVGPYRASIFYASDRYDASFKIRKWLEEGRMVVCDRYFLSNVGHQGGKIKDKKQREKYLKWLFDLEFNLFGIPKPDFTFVLKVSPLISQDLVGRITDRKKKAKKKSFLGKEKRDLHEKDISHLINAQNSYLEAVKEFPRDFTLIDCIEENTLLPAKSIHEKVWEKIKKII